MTKAMCGLVRGAGLRGRTRLAAADSHWDALAPPAGSAVQPAFLVDQRAIHVATYRLHDRHRMPKGFENRLQVEHVEKPPPVRARVRAEGLPGIRTRGNGQANSVFAPASLQNAGPQCGTRSLQSGD